MDEEASSWIRRTKFSQTVSHRLDSSKLSSLSFKSNQEKLPGPKTTPSTADVYVVDSEVQINPVTNKQRSVSPSPQTPLPQVFKEAKSERKRFSTPHPRRIDSEKAMKPKFSTFEKRRSISLQSPSVPIRDLSTLRIQERVKTQSKKDNTGWSKLLNNGGRKVSASEAAEEYRVDMSKLLLGLKFAHGLHSRLYHGKYEDKAVAVKLITVPDDDENGCLGARLEKQFTKEVTLLSRLTHPNVIKVIPLSFHIFFWPFLLKFLFLF